MKLLPRKASGFTLIELMVCLVVVGVLVWMVIPQNRITTCTIGPMGGALSNARQLHLATQMMALDTYDSGGDGMEWTMRSSHGKTVSVSLTEYFNALVKNNYLTRADLGKLLTVSERRPPKDLTAGNICFKIFQMDEESPSDQPFVVTANWSPMGLAASPYGRKGFVVFAKGGSGGIYTRPADMTSEKLFPPGSSYNYSTLQ